MVRGPQDRSSPEQTLSQRQFFEVLELCMEHLPMTQGRVLMMHDWLELGTDEICKELAITSTHCGSCCTGRDCVCGIVCKWDGLQVAR